jgi:hypothetical protein
MSRTGTSSDGIAASLLGPIFFSKASRQFPAESSRDAQESQSEQTDAGRFRHRGQLIRNLPLQIGRMAGGRTRAGQGSIRAKWLGKEARGRVESEPIVYERETREDSGCGEGADPMGCNEVA